MGNLKSAMLSKFHWVDSTIKLPSCHPAIFGGHVKCAELELIEPSSKGAIMPEVH